MSCFSQTRQRRIIELLSPGRSFCPARVGAGHPAGSQCSGPVRWSGREDARYSADASCPYVKIFPDCVFGCSVSLIKLNCVPDFNILAGFLWANDLSGSRTARLQRTLQSFVPKELRGEDKIRVTSLDGRKWRNMEDLEFDRVSISDVFWQRETWKISNKIMFCFSCVVCFIWCYLPFTVSPFASCTAAQMSSVFCI